MRVDWIIAVVTFLMFVTWAITYYSNMPTAGEFSVSSSAMKAGKKITDYMKTQYTTLPANITSPASASNAVMWAYMNWTGNETNTTRVVLDRLSNTSLDCMVSGSRLYWRADLSSGENYFFIQYADMQSAMNCDHSLTESDENQTTPWAAERMNIFSSSRNSQFCALANSSYEGLKDSIGTTFDFNVLIGEGGPETECGLPVPISGRDVFVFRSSGRLWEGGEVNVSVRLWQ
jgi:hypothetical protein